MSVRTRFAPSPTGFLHIGGARTALFSCLYARHHGGQFILRIEDTDRERSTPEATQAILDSLTWLGLRWDEGPFFQSERSEIYREHAERLLSTGRAYWCTCLPEELDARRKAALVEGRKPVYDGTCRDAGHRDGWGKHALRFKAPKDGDTAFKDLVKGPIVFQNRELDDLILVRSDGSSTYNFCVVVDDALMQITHIIRGEDHLTNTARQIQLYVALDLPVPQFASLPLILGIDRARLSKRHGATSVGAYREEGYLPEAMVNYLARLGWAHGDQEIFTREELIEKFTLEAVGSSAGVFNPEKLLWVNFEHIKRMSPQDLAAAVRPFLESKGYAIRGDDHWLAAMAKTLQERAKTLVEMAELARFYFADEIELDSASAEKHLRTANPDALKAVSDGLYGVSEWSEEAIKGVFDEVLQRFDLKLGKLAQPVRVALTGGTVSPGIFEVIFVIGKEQTLKRLDRALGVVG